MYQKNNTTVTEFFLLGFENLHMFRIPFFILVLFTYIMTVVSNLFIVLLVSTSKNLYTPMYFFLRHLSLCDALLTTDIVPNMLNTILEEVTPITVFGCLTQFQMFGCCCTAECYLLTVMSFDRYLAICNPLRYANIMDFKLCFSLVTLSWATGFVFALITRILINELKFCNHNRIYHFFCDFLPILDLSCSDTSIVKLEAFLVLPLVVVFPFVFVIVTYIYIFITILGISSTTGRQKTFSTCSSHLSVVCVFYGTLIGIYLSPSKGYSPNIDKFPSLFYTLVTPLLNPIIYSLRNQEIKKALNVFFRIKEIKNVMYCELEY